MHARKRHAAASGNVASGCDGGALRVHSDGTYYEILPDAGSLVLFDSMAVEHEVRPTRRERTCLIGWFHAPT